MGENVSEISYSREEKKEKIVALKKLIQGRSQNIFYYCKNSSYRMAYIRSISTGHHCNPRFIVSFIVYIKNFKLSKTK